MIAYKYLVWMTLLVFGVSGAWLGWWYASKTIYLRSLGSETLSDADIKPTVLLRRQVRRIILTAGGAVVGVFAGLIALQSLTRFQS